MYWLHGSNPRRFIISPKNGGDLCANGRAGQAQYKFRISALLRFQYYVFSFLMLAKKNKPARIPSQTLPPRGQNSESRRISKTFVSVLRTLSQKIVFAKPSPFFLERLISQYLSRSAFPRTFSLRKLCASHRGVRSTRGETLVIIDFENRF